MPENVDVSTAEVHVAYDGAAVREGYMDVRDLGPALLGIGALCSQANAVLNGNRATVTVAVRSDFKTGSFKINFEVIQTVLEAVKGLLLKDPVATAKDIAELVGLTGIPAGLLWLIRRIGARKVESVTPQQDQVTIKIEGDNNTVIVARDVYRLFENPTMRNAAREVLRPLEEPGIDEFQVLREDAVVDRITKEELPIFQAELPPEAEEVLTDYTIPSAAYRIIKPSLERGLTWKLSDGQSKIDAYLRDEEFWNRMESDENYRFGVGDVVIVQIGVKSYRSEKGAFRTEYNIEKVLDFKHRSRQMMLGEDVDRS